MHQFDGRNGHAAPSASPAVIGLSTVRRHRQALFLPSVLLTASLVLTGCSGAATTEDDQPAVAPPSAKESYLPSALADGTRTDGGKASDGGGSGDGGRDRGTPSDGGGDRGTATGGSDAPADGANGPGGNDEGPTADDGAAGPSASEGAGTVTGAGGSAGGSTPAPGGDNTDGAGTDSKSGNAPAGNTPTRDARPGDERPGAGNGRGGHPGHAADHASGANRPKTPAHSSPDRLRGAFASKDRACRAVSAQMLSIAFAPLSYSYGGGRSEAKKAVGQLTALKKKVPGELRDDFARVESVFANSGPGYSNFNETAFEQAVVPIEAWVLANCPKL